MNKQFLFFLIMAVFFFMGCNKLGISDNNAEKEYPVIISVLAKTQAGSIYRVTISGPGMQTIGPDEYESGQFIEIYVPVGINRAFHLEKYDQNMVMIDSGTTLADVGAVMSTIAVTLVNVTYRVTYNGNDNTGGIAPIDSVSYIQGDNVTVIANTDNLTRTGYVFVGWNTSNDGSGDDYVPGASNLIINDKNVTLYAKWSADTIIATVSIDDTVHLYDGTPKSVSVTTNPPGLSLSVTYAGSENAPIHTGTYIVWVYVTQSPHTGTASATLTINQATPTITSIPMSTSITYGQPLDSAVLSNGVASVSGSFTFTSPAFTPNSGSAKFPITFTPYDIANYNTATDSVEVTVFKATPTITTAPTVSDLVFGQNLASAVFSNGVASISGSFTFTISSTVPVLGTSSHSLVFTPIDTANYNAVTFDAIVTVVKAIPVITITPNSSDLTYGQALSASTLSGGVVSVPGSFAFDSPLTVPNAGSVKFPITFTPDDTTNYNKATDSVEVTVFKDTPIISAIPTVADFVYGQNLASASFSNGTASIAGTFAFSSPTTVPDIGTSNYSVTFTPDIIANFNTVDTIVSLTVIPRPSVTDIDGNVYSTVVIGAQLWTIENLRTTRFNDGNAIPLITDNAEWNTATYAYCFYNNDTSKVNQVKWGALYNWTTVGTGKLEPATEGWRIPSFDDWTLLETSLGGVSVSAGKLKEAGTLNWTSPNLDATNSSGFTALPGGDRDFGGQFKSMGASGIWWTSTFKDGAYWYLVLNYNSKTVDNMGTYNTQRGFSVRLVKDLN